MIYSTNAIILNTLKYGDTSIICNLFSQDYGKVSLIAKGARTIKNPNKAILQPLHHIEIDYYYKPKRNLQILKEASICNHFNNIKLNYTKLSYAFICLETLDKLSQIDNPCNILFRLIISTLKTIDKDKENKILLYYIFFQFQLLKYIGYQPSFDLCFLCDVNISNGFYDHNIGHIVCKQCLNTKNYIKLDSDIQDIMNLLNTTHIKNLAQIIDSNNDNLNIINQFLTTYMPFHIGNFGPIKSLQLLN